ncbi:MAG TPA: hypothetical protein VIX59_21615 [Candidatus Binataceae bacterium]
MRIACVYVRDYRPDFLFSNMAGIRWYRMAEALALRGHQVDIVVDRNQEPALLAPRLREVPFRFVRWEDYDVVKTFFHRGFETLAAAGGDDHPFIISKLGSVVGRAQTAGVHFYGSVRDRLFNTQTEIARRSKVVTVLTNRSAALWWREHGSEKRLYQVPTGVDAEIAPLGVNPYLRLGIEGPVALFAGNLYSRRQQEEINLAWQNRLNHLGHLLKRRGISLVAMGTGQTDHLDPAAVTHVGMIDGREVWDWQRYARVGLVLAQAAVQDNESSKIYYYLRTGLPVVCEESVPNKWLIEETGFGAIVPYNQIEAMADAAADLAARSNSDANGVVEYMVEKHSWDVRAALYDPVLRAVSQYGGVSQSNGSRAQRLEE